MCNALLMSHVPLFRTPLFMRLVPLFFMGFVTFFFAHLFCSRARPEQQQIRPLLTKMTRKWRQRLRIASWSLAEKLISTPDTIEGAWLSSS